MKKILFVHLLVLTALFAARAETEDGGFRSKLSAGVSLARGNSETVQANMSLLTEGEKPDLGSVRAGVEGNYGESKSDGSTEKTVENMTAFLNAKKTLRPRTFGYLDSRVFRDAVAKVDYRVTLGPGFGAYLVKRESASLSAEAGPSYIWDKVDGVHDGYIVLRFAERLDYMIGDIAEIWQSVEYLPRPDDFGDFLLNAELGIESAINARLGMRLVLQNKYDSTPAEDLKKNDFSLIAGLSLSL